MASTQNYYIETVSHPSMNVSAQNDMNTETTRLVKIKSSKQKPLLQRFRKNVLIKSKAVNMILFWNSLVYLLYGSLLLVNPENVFLVNTHAAIVNFFKIFSNFRLHINNDYRSIPLNIIGCVVYGVIAVWLLFQMFVMVGIR